MKIQSPQELGALIRRERNRLGWTQAALADRVGVRPLWISEFERGKPTAQIGLVLRTLKALDLFIRVGEGREEKDSVSTIDLDDILDPGVSESFVREGEEFVDSYLRKVRGKADAEGEDE
ncbi:MAG: transcriptional regulator [Verrucomicrobiales bacterium]|nr:transcriptional regulator [Verrucomicrobiales bacterium]